MAIVASLLGLMAISGDVTCYGLSVLLLPLIVVVAETRREACISLMSYFLTAALILPKALVDYRGDKLGVVLVLVWIACASIPAGIWVMCWDTRFRNRVRNAVIAILVFAIPPLGVIGVLNPLSGLGTVFPHTGLSGIATYISVFLLVSFKYDRTALALIAGLYSLSWAMAGPIEKSRWHGVTTSYEIEPNDAAFEVYDRLLSELSVLGPHRHLVYPEGFLNSVTVPDVSALVFQNPWVESAVFGFEPSRGVNGVIYLEKNGRSIFYPQRQPIPITMWSPGSESHYSANWFAKPVIRVRDRTIAPIVCYEVLLVWPVVTSIVYGADDMIVVTNVKWDTTGRIERLIRAVSYSWKQLFRVPAAIAINR